MYCLTHLSGKICGHRLSKRGGIPPPLTVRWRFPPHYEKKHTEMREGIKMSELLGITKLRNRLNLKKIRVDTRYRYYEMKNIIRDFEISTPPNLRGFQTVLGWCGKSVDSISDRLMFR